MTVLGLRSSGRLGLSPRGRRPSSLPFSPDQIPDLVFWYRAGDPQNTVTGGAIEQAFDLSGNGRHGMQSTSSQRPLDTVDLDARSIMRFDGVDDFLQVAAPPSLADGVTVFMAYRIRQHVNGGGLIVAGIAGGGAGDEQFFEFASQSAANRTALEAKTAQPNPAQTAARIDPTDKNYVIFTIADDSAEVRDFLGTVSDSSTSVALATPDLIAIGARALNQSAVAPFSFIDVYEVGMYARALNGVEVDQLESCLTAKHKIHWSPGYLDADLAWWHDDLSNFSLSGSLVSQWSDRSGKGRDWSGSGPARPTRTVNSGQVVVRFDGVDDVLSLDGSLPTLEPFTAAIVYRVRNRSDFQGVLSAAAAGGVDHESFWTFEIALAASNDMQLFGGSLNSNQLFLTRSDGGVAQIAIWTTATGVATLRDRVGEVGDSYGGSFGMPAAVVLGARFNAGPFGHAEVDVMGTVGVTSALAPADQLKLIDWAVAKWGV